MEVFFRTKQLKKLFSKKNELNKKFGTEIAKSIMVKYTALKAFETLEDIPPYPPFSKHLLSKKKIRSLDVSGCIAIDAKNRSNGVRIVLKPVDENGNQVSIDSSSEVRHVMIMYVGNYH